MVKKRQQIYLVPPNRYDFGSFMNNVGAGKGLGSFGSGFSGLSSGMQAGLGAVGQAVGGMVGGAISGGMTSGAGSVIDGLSNVASAIPGPWGAIAGAGLKVVGGLVNRAFGSKLNQENINAVENNISSLNSFQTNAKDYDALGQTILSQPAAMTFDKKFIGKDGWFSSKAKKKFKSLQEQQKNATQFIANSIDNNLDNISTTQAQNLAANFAALGGPLFMTGKGIMSPFGKRFDAGGTLNSPLHSYGADWTNGLVFVNNGNTHESNPYEGVQMGVDEQGVPNLVEEGEVIWNNYVFSNRMKVPKTIREKYKLRGQKDLTFADAVKNAQKESEERPNDPISQRGLEDILVKLAMAQENQREQMNRENTYSQGGSITIKPSKRGTFTAAATKHGKSVQEFASQVLANPENYSPAMRKKANFARNAAKWNAYGGNLYYDGSWLDRIYTWSNNRRKAKGAIDYINSNPNLIALLNTTNQIGINDSPKETKQINYGDREWLKPITGLEPTGIGGSIGKLPTKENIKAPANRTFNPSITDESEEGGSWLANLRYVPALGAGINVFTDLMGWTNKPDYSNADAVLEASRGVRDVSFNPIGDYMRYTPFDRMFYLNQLNANAGASRRNILNTSGGNRGAAMAGILASDYGTLGQIGQLARQAEEYNLGMRQKVADFNRATNMFNSEGSLKAQQANQGAAEVRMRAAQAAAQLRDAIDARVGAARSANLTNLFESIGDIGREEFARNMINSNRAQYYTIGRDGTIHYKPQFYNQSLENQKELRKQAAEDRKAYMNSRSKANGGFITIKRR